jgi:PleD family two-component response regulator
MEQRTEIPLVGETTQSCLQLMQWLESRGCRCHFASSCKDACRLVSDMRFDFVLSHFELPERSAFRFFQS